MTKFLVERDFPGAGNFSDVQMRDLSRKSVNVQKEMGPGVEWLHSYVTGDKVYCVYIAPDEAAVREHSKRLGMPVTRISAVRGLLDPELGNQEF